MQSTLRVITAAAAVVLLAGGLTACRGADAPSPSGSAGPASYTVTVGTDLSSAFSSACCGIPIANGFKTAIAAANDDGGVNGTPIKVDSLDDRADVATGLANYQQALSSDTLGFFLTSASTVLTPIAARATVDGIASSSIGGYMGGTGAYPFVYNSLPNSASYVKAVSGYAKSVVKDTKGAKIAYFTYDSTLTETFQKDMTSKFTDDGWNIVYNQLVPSATSDFSVAAGSIASATPDVIVVDLLEGQLPTFVQQIRAHGIDTPIVNFSSNIQDSTVAKINDPNLLLVAFTAPATDKTNKAVVNMQKEAEAAGLTQGDENPFFITGYVQGKIVVAALKTCAPNCTRESFNDALKNTTVPGDGLMAGNPGFAPEDHVMVKKLVIEKYDAKSNKTVFLDGYGLDD